MLTHPNCFLSIVRRPKSLPDALLAEALRRQLALHKPCSTPFSLHTVRGKLVTPNLDLDRTSKLIELDDQMWFKIKVACEHRTTKRVYTS